MGRVERKEMRFPSSGAAEGGDRVAAGTTSEQRLSRGRIAKQTNHWQQVKQAAKRKEEKRKPRFQCLFLENTLSS